MDVFLKFEFRVGRSPNFRASGGQKSPFSYSTHIAYTTACCYRTSCDRPTCLQCCNVVFPAFRHSQSQVAGHLPCHRPVSLQSAIMPEEELIEPDEIDDIHDAVIVNGIDRYSDISEPASCRAAVRPSVCPSVRSTHAGTVSKRLQLRSWGLHCTMTSFLMVNFGAKFQRDPSEPGSRMRQGYRTNKCK